VLVVDKDGKAWSKTVKVLNDDGTRDAITGDVQPGDKVVIEGQLRVSSGQAVQVAGGKPPARP
jgi:multidrug efflux pump subunit AcrA (membrane-fusion protein)